MFGSNVTAAVCPSTDPTLAGVAAAAAVAAEHVDDVDRQARFPHEGVDALKDSRALSALAYRFAGKRNATVFGATLALPTARDIDRRQVRLRHHMTRRDLTDHHDHRRFRTGCGVEVATQRCQTHHQRNCQGDVSRLPLTGPQRQPGGRNLRTGHRRTVDLWFTVKHSRSTARQLHVTSPQSESARRGTVNWPTS